MEFRFHPTKGDKSNSENIYFTKEYLLSQNHEDLILFEDENFLAYFSLKDDIAISIPKSPFGSYLSKKSNSEDFDSFESNACSKLKTRNVRSLEIRHPSIIYGEFIEPGVLKMAGHEVLYTDINQHIELRGDWEGSIHKMQERKLHILLNEGFEFKIMPKSYLKTAHQFIRACRESQGLEINISWDRLSRLDTAMPGRYQCFGVFRENKISAACITVNVDDEVVYYYLPATSPMFRSKSPMVLLIAGMVGYYQDKEVNYLDLGVSSFRGIPQETLRIFKNRMGAQETSKHTFIKTLT